MAGWTRRSMRRSMRRLICRLQRRLRLVAVKAVAKDLFIRRVNLILTQRQHDALKPKMSTNSTIKKCTYIRYYKLFEER